MICGGASSARRVRSLLSQPFLGGSKMTTSGVLSSDEKSKYSARPMWNSAFWTWLRVAFRRASSMALGLLSRPMSRDAESDRCNPMLPVPQ